MIVNYKKVYFPKVQQKFWANIINTDIENTVRDKTMQEAEVTYEVMQCSGNFFSYLKSIYLKDSMSPNGYFSWDICLNYYLENEKLYKIYFTFDKIEIDSFIHASIKQGIIEEFCLMESQVSAESQSYFFKKGKLYFHNPISYPVCWIDLNMSFSIENLSFKE
ncbi:MAG TPA: hypothetical protein VLZ75_02050 [Chitinophagales bacterium]|nr:hypothetical protein [Chitinophagales bacterium]